MPRLVGAAALAAAAALTLASATDPVHNMSLVMLPAGAPRDAGSCLDGSPYGMYQILNASSPNWIIYFDGGGACESPAGCVKRAANGSRLGSSKKWAPTFVANSLLEKRCELNPRCSWNMVRLPYCDGSVFSGTQTKMAPEGYIAAGHFNAAAAIRTLLADTPLAKAEKVLVSGASAGGIGAFLHADYVRELPQLKHADVRAAPLCGWFFPDVASFADWEKNNSATVDYDHIRDEANSGLWTDKGVAGAGWVDESCRAALQDKYYMCSTVDVMSAPPPPPPAHPTHTDTARLTWHARQLQVPFHRDAAFHR